MEKQELEFLRKISLIKANLECKHSTQVDLCAHGCKKTREGKTFDEAMHALERSGDLKIIRVARKIGEIVGKTTFWTRKMLIVGGTGYVIFLAGKRIYAYIERKNKNS